MFSDDSDVGEPRALAFDDKSQTLYIADAARRQIWAVAADGKKPKLTSVSRAISLKEPSGLTLDGAGRIWVSDERIGAVFLLSSTGGVARTVR
jgi:sugar lactone lactonase YvrE